MSIKCGVNGIKIGECSFLLYDCDVILYNYEIDGGIAICLSGSVGTEYEGEPIADATKYIEGGSLGYGEVYIKNYSENTGILQSLQTAKIVGNILGTKATGMTYVHKVKISDDILNKLEEDE